jgi:hypothetical protein
MNFDITYASVLSIVFHESSYRHSGLKLRMTCPPELTELAAHLTVSPAGIVKTHRVKDRDVDIPEGMQLFRGTIGAYPIA